MKKKAMKKKIKKLKHQLKANNKYFDDYVKFLISFKIYRFKNLEQQEEVDKVDKFAEQKKNIINDSTLSEEEKIRLLREMTNTQKSQDISIKSPEKVEEPTELNSTIVEEVKEQPKNPFLMALENLNKKADAEKSANRISEESSKAIDNLFNDYISQSIVNDEVETTEKSEPYNPIEEIPETTEYIEVTKEDGPNMVDLADVMAALKGGNVTIKVNPIPEDIPVVDEIETPAEIPDDIEFDIPDPEALNSIAVEESDSIDSIEDIPEVEETPIEIPEEFDIPEITDEDISIVDEIPNDIEFDIPEDIPSEYIPDEPFENEEKKTIIPAYRKYTQADVDKVIEAKNKGWTWVEIQDKYWISISTLRKMYNGTYFPNSTIKSVENKSVENQNKDNLEEYKLDDGDYADFFKIMSNLNDATSSQEDMKHFKEELKAKAYARISATLKEEEKRKKKGKGFFGFGKKKSNEEASE